jgi:hypothetical protein
MRNLRSALCCGDATKRPAVHGFAVLRSGVFSAAAATAAAIAIVALRHFCYAVLATFARCYAHVGQLLLLLLLWLQEPLCTRVLQPVQDRSSCAAVEGTAHGELVFTELHIPAHDDAVARNIDAPAMLLAFIVANENAFATTRLQLIALLLQWDMHDGIAAEHPQMSEIGFVTAP